MAQTHPNSELIGFDNQRPPIGRERNAAGHNVRVRFEQAADKEFPGKEYDFVAVFDCLHDIGDPVGAARHVREVVKQGGFSRFRRAAETPLYLIFEARP